MTDPKYNENTGMRIMRPGEIFDPNRVVDADAEMVTVDHQADMTTNSLGGVDFILEVNKNPIWRKKVRMILKPKPEHMTKEQWQAAVDLVVQQSEEIDAPNYR